VNLSLPSWQPRRRLLAIALFISLVARLLVFVTAWTATGSDAPPKAIQPPAPVVLEPVVVVDPPIAVPATVGVVTGVLGTLLALKWRRSRG